LGLLATSPAAATMALFSQRLPPHTFMNFKLASWLLKRADGTPRPFSWRTLTVVALLCGLGYAMFASLQKSGVIGTSSGDQTQSFAEAKAALLAYALGNPRIPGALPCPDMDADGEAEFTTNGACPNVLGRLPWKTLGLDNPVRDAGGESLWYALSPNFRDDASAQPVNVANKGLVSLGAESDLAALIIGPGRKLDGQGSRGNTFRPTNRITEYLESPTSDSGLSFATSSATKPVNDSFVAINRKELMFGIAQRAATDLDVHLGAYQLVKDAYPADQAALNAYLDERLPGGHWLQSNRWVQIATYTVNDDKTATLRFEGCSAGFTLSFPADIKVSGSGC
jgi:hypothetical protein